jgi:hypothetical protein
MCRVPPAGMLLVVSVTEPVRAVVDVERTTGPVQGQIAVGAAASGGFCGWLELIDRLDRAASLCSAEGEGARDRDAT